MKNQPKNQQKISGRSSSAADQIGPNDWPEDRIAWLARQSLAMPGSHDFLEAHARALATVAAMTPTANWTVISLFDPAVAPCRRLDGYNSFSPQQRQRLDDVLDDVGRNPHLSDEEFIRRACVALDRIPLGEIFVTANAAASSIPAQYLFLALLRHRQCPVDCPASQPDQSGWTVTSYRELDAAWPEFVVMTEPGGGATVIALRWEVPAISADPSRN